MSVYFSKLSRFFVVLCVSCLLMGCGEDYWLFDPKGPIAEAQMWLLIISALIMLIVVIPVKVMGVWFPIKYRASNKKSEYLPHWEHSNKIEAVVWLIPLLIILVLGIITYITSYSLDPRKPIKEAKSEMVVQVVAMDWKWLFIYPEYEIATVNEMAIPVDAAVEFLVTSDTVMNSFFIPQLGTQIYAMSGMENRVHLLASETGEYHGLSANYSGFGFSGMKFKAHALSEVDFKKWVTEVKAQDNPLDSDAFSELQEKSRDVEPVFYSSVNPLLFSDIIERYSGALNGK